MKPHTSGFKENIIELGRELKGVITYGNTTLEEEIYSITPHYNADLLKSVMKQLDLELSVDIPLETVINCQIGIKVNNDYEMLDYGNYVVYNSEKQEDAGTYKITCYDKMLYSMKQNEDLEISYPITIKNYLRAIAEKIGLTLATQTFYNEDLTIPSELYLGLEYTYRDILDEIAQSTGSIIVVNENDEIEVKYPTQTNDTIDEDFFKDINVDFGQKYGPINSIVLSRSGESDNVYLQDTESVQENGLTEIKIVDNQIMNFNNRSDFLQGILDALDGLYYYINDYSSTGILYYEVGDLYNVQIGENIYQCLMLNDEINVTTGIEEMVHTDIPQKSETDYSKADKTDMKINQTYIIVDKQNQKIDSVVNNVTEQNNKISQITQTVDEINSKISDIADITTYGESDRAYVELTDINNSEPIMIKVHPTSTNISYLYPRNNLYPSDTLYMPDRKIRFTRTYEEEGETITENIDYELPDDLLRYSSEVYDEFYLDYDSQTCQVIKRCAYNADGTVSALGTEITTDYPYPEILLGDGNYSISLYGYDFGYVYVRLMAKNIYTQQFYTKVETNSKISQKADEIDLEVNQKLSNYSTTSEMNSAITIKANEINSTVSQKVGKNELISSINQSAEAVTINANKVNLSGKTINLTSDNIKISSTNFNVDKNGNVTANSLTSNNATITGGKLNVTGGTRNNPNVSVSDGSYSTKILPQDIYITGSDASINVNHTSNSSSHAYLYADSDGGGITLGGNASNDITLRAGNSPTIRCYGNMYANAYNYNSKKEFKKNIEKFNDNAIDIISNSDLYSFNYKNEKDSDKKHIGFIIGDEYRTPIEIISQNGESIDSYSTISILWKAFQEYIEKTNAEMEQMKKQIEELKGGK